jgi:hypothetical protein
MDGMDEGVLSRTILRAISARGTATLETVIIRLAPRATAMDVARAFQTVRGRGWISEAKRRDAGRGDPSYELTEGGLRELTRVHALARSVADGGDADRDVPLQSVLRVFADFEPFGGASIELVAWELGVDQRQLQAAWSEAIGSGLLEPFGRQNVDGIEERVWGLTGEGRARVQEPERTPGVAPEPSGGLSG